MNLPNKLTIARVIAVPIFVLMYMNQMYLLSTIIFILASVTDYFDGMIARKYNLVSNFGKIMDPLADKILVYSALCLLLEDHVIASWALAIILTREFAIAGIRTVAASEGIVIAAGMSGKIKTVFQMISVPLLLLWNTSYINENILSKITIVGMVFFWISLVMTVYSGLEYILKNKKVFSC